MCKDKEQEGDNIENMQKELELQLHEQYAINNNANVSSFIAMITALIIAFSGYGYVLYQYLMGDVYCCKMADAKTMVDIATFAVLTVIFILYMVAIEVGAGQRSNQFVVHAIRKKAYSKTQYEEVFPKGYDPFDKGFCGFVQGIYNTLSKIFFVIYWGVLILSWITFGWDCVYFAYIVGGILMLIFRCCKYCRYKSTSDYFKTKLGENKEPSKKKRCISILLSQIQKCIRINSKKDKAKDKKADKKVIAKSTTSDSPKEEKLKK